MDAREFVLQVMQELVMLFPQVRVRYEQHELSNTHLVEVMPAKVYHQNEAFKRWEEETIIRFIEEQFGDGLCFISDNSAVGIEQVDYELQGASYAASEYINRSIPINRDIYAQSDENWDIAIHPQTYTEFYILKHLYTHTQNRAVSEYHSEALVQVDGLEDSLAFSTAA